MPRPRVWTGSRWADAKVWTGSQWKGYTPPVFGATAYRQDFNGAGLHGFVGGGGTDGTQYPVSNWSNVHIYVDTNIGWIYPDSGKMYRGDLSGNGPALDTFYVRQGTEIRVQASLLRHHASGAVGTGSGSAWVRVGLSPVTANEFYASSAAATVDFPNGNNMDAVVTTAVGSGVTLPSSGDTDRVVGVNLTYVEIYHSQSYSGMGEGPGVVRLYCDWIRLVDAAGNEIPRMTTPADDPIKVWSGSAWV